MLPIRFGLKALLMAESADRHAVFLPWSADNG